MTQKEINARNYRKKRISGLCPRCGNPLDREGYYCSECLIKRREYRKGNKDFYRENHICTECGKEKVFGDEKTCPECRAKIENRRRPLSVDQKMKYEIRFRSQQNMLYQQRSEQGICTRCGKRKAMAGRKKCGICLEKDARIHRLKYTQKEEDEREFRLKNGLCYRCGEKLDRDGKFCSKCQRDIEIHLADARKKQMYWRENNKLIFGNGGMK